MPYIRPAQLQFLIEVLTLLYCQHHLDWDCEHVDIFGLPWRMWYPLAYLFLISTVILIPPYKFI